jgi:hypothetical protein
VSNGRERDDLDHVSLRFFYVRYEGNSRPAQFTVATLRRPSATTSQKHASEAGIKVKTDLVFHALIEIWRKMILIAPPAHRRHLV